jgi:MFS family permease
LHCAGYRDAVGGCGLAGYEITKRPLDLGLVGLAQFLPGVLLFLVSGHVADRYDRRKVVVACYAAFSGCSGLLLFAALRHTHSIYPIYVVVILIGIVRAFNAPVSRALLPQLVPEEHFPNAVAWASSVFQTATILGPSAGGAVYAVARGPRAVYAMAAMVATVCAWQIKVESKARAREPINVANVLAGFHYIWRQRLILGAISLDLFAVLLGGAVALLPVYAREILMTGPWGLGISAERAGHRGGGYGGLFDS